MSPYFAEIELSPEQIESQFNLINKIKDFKAIAENVINLVHVLNINFKPKTLERVTRFKENVSEETLPFEIVLESFSELPKIIKNADSEKIAFISNFCSKDNYIGENFAWLIRRTHEFHQDVIFGAQGEEIRAENQENRRLFERRAGRAPVEGAEPFQSDRRVHQENQETGKSGQILQIRAK